MKTRRQALKLTAASVASVTSSSSFYSTSAVGQVVGNPLHEAARAARDPGLEGQVGLVTASLSAHIVATEEEAKTSGGEKFTLLELPRLMRDELGELTIFDLNSMNLPSLEPAYLDRLRRAVEDAGCVSTNLKLNQPVDMSHPDPAVRAEAMRQYQAAIEAAAWLGMRWVRPLPRKEAPHDMAVHLTAFWQLIDFAGERGLTVLVENFGWMESDPDAVVNLLESINQDLPAIRYALAGVDTGNWSSNEVRYPALEKTFPCAVTCDFKVKALGPDGEHPAYDLKQCFDIARASGFRGPWAIEHGNKDRKQAFAEISRIAAWLREWSKD